MTLVDTARTPTVDCADTPGAAAAARQALERQPLDLLVSEVLRTNELQVWFLSEHLVAATPV